MKSLKKISEKMKKTSPVFIVGAPRSGTSILYRVLQEHTAFRPKRTDLTETRIFSYSNQSYLFEPMDPQGTRLLDYMLGDLDQYEEFLASIDRIQHLHKRMDMTRTIKNSLRSLVLKQNSTGNNSDRSAKISSKAARRWYASFWDLNLNHPIIRRLSYCLKWLGWHLGANHRVVRGFFHYAQIARGCDRIVEKTPLGYRNIKEIKWTFPEAKLVYIYRHPVDVFSSYRKRMQFELKKDKYALDWLDISPTLFCIRYRTSIELAQRESNCQRQPMHLVKYEIFTSDPIKESQRIFAFLNESLEDEKIIEDKRHSSRWTPDPLLFGPIVPQTKDWSDYMTLAEARYIEAELRGTMQDLGYTSFTNCW